MDKSAITPESIMQVAGGFMASKFLFVASHIGLFSALGDGPLGVEELARRTGCPARTVRIVADAMASLGFVASEGGAYRNNQVAQTFLAGKTPADLRPFLRFWDRISFPKWLGLEQSVRTEQSQTGGSFTEEDQRVFNEGVAAITTGAAMALAEAIDWSKHQRVLDLGGGTGNFLVALLRRHPSLRGTLFDLPGAAAVARRVLGGSAEASRIEIVEGDMIAGAIPSGADAILLANVFHGFSPANNVAVLTKARGAVAKGARLYGVDFWLDPTRTQPTFAALMSGEFLIMTGEGQSYREADLRAWAGETGWAVVDAKPLLGPASVVVCEAR